MKIHHNTAKKAQKFGITLEVIENDIVASHDGVTLVSGPQGNSVLERAIQLLGANGQMPLVEEGRKQRVTKAKANGARKPKITADEYDDLDFADEADDELAAAEDEESDADQGRSIVKRKYKQDYRPFRQTCGDDFAELMAEETRYVNEDGDERTDEAALRKLAERNKVWKDSYIALNVGQRRMTIGVRLRAMLKRGEEIKWKRAR